MVALAPEPAVRKTTGAVNAVPADVCVMLPVAVKLIKFPRFEPSVTVAPEPMLMLPVAVRLNCFKLPELMAAPDAPVRLTLLAEFTNTFFVLDAAVKITVPVPLPIPRLVVELPTSPPELDSVMAGAVKAVPACAWSILPTDVRLIEVPAETVDWLLPGAVNVMGALLVTLY